MRPEASTSRQASSAGADLRLIPHIADRPRMWSAGQTALGIGIATLLFVGGSGLIVSPEGTWSNKSTVTGAGVLASMLLFSVGSLLTASLRGPERLEIGINTLGFNSLSWANFVAFGLIAAVGMGVIFGAYAAVAEQVGSIPSARDELPIIWTAERHRVLFFASVTVLRPFAEEVLFRGFVMQGLTERLQVPAAAAVASALYALTHVGGGPGLVIPAFGAGLLLAWVFWRSGSLWPAILGNVVFTAVTLDSRIG